jgi:hypothetical protein
VSTGSFSLSGLLCFVALLAAAGCTNIAKEGSCLATRTALASPNEPTPLGFTGAQLLGAAQGSYVGRLTWMAVNASEVSINVGPGETGLVMKVTPNGGVRLVDQENPGTDPIFCQDSLEADVHVEVATDDGALSEKWQATVSGPSPMEASISVDLETLPPSGALRAEAGPRQRPEADFLHLPCALW